MKELRIGFIGSGWINEIHAASLLKQPGVTLAAIYNHNLSRATAFNQKILGGAAVCFDDHRKMIQTQKLDAIYVAIPPGAHGGEVEFAAEHGIHLMLEKPIALSMERAESIADVVKKAGVVCEIGHHMRHSEPARKLKDLLTSGEAGRPLFLNARFWTNGLFPAWWRDPNLGGGQLVEQAIHMYDLARYYLGEPDVISAFADNLNHRQIPDYKVDDVSASVIRFKNGSIASITASNCSDPKTPGTTLTLQCQNVIAEFSAPDKATFAYTDGRVADQLWKDGFEIRREDVKSENSMYDDLAADFLAGIREGKPTRSSIEDGVESLRLVLAASKSAQQNGAAQKM